ncbi:MAG: hypothetical protein HY736_18285 [Verrucomicrobia bacterium]|nr:hypothetical protein [Verrucomicrobiota bacterium]
MHDVPGQLVSYIAPAAPATRRPADGTEVFLRPEIGFTPAWFRQHVDIDFGQRFHDDPAYRRDAVVRMQAELRRRFPGTPIGQAGPGDAPLDLLTGMRGACPVAALYGVPILYTENNWPCAAPQYLSDADVARLEPPDLARNPHFAQLMEQLDWIERHEGRIDGYINWQGVLNNAHRLRGQQLFLDLLDEPERCRHLFACVCETMIQGIRLLHVRQSRSGEPPRSAQRFVTVSNCLVNLVSPEVYRDLLLPFDQKLAAVYGCIGIHNCAWNATPYLEAYARVPGVAYIDMGIHSDLTRARGLFPHARRGLMYTPMDAMNKPRVEIEADVARVARDLGPCDLIVADIDAGSPDTRVHEIIRLAESLSV